MSHLHSTVSGTLADVFAPATLPIDKISVRQLAPWVDDAIKTREADARRLATSTARLDIIVTTLHHLDEEARQWRTEEEARLKEATSARDAAFEARDAARKELADWWKAAGESYGQ